VAGSISGSENRVGRGACSDTWFDPVDYGGLDDTVPSATVIVELLDQAIGPSSVVDVGCGPGIFVAEWIRHGVDDVWGLDGAPAAAVYQAPSSTFRVVDLSQGIETDRRFDLAICLEVAEHLSSEHEELLVSSLVNLAPVVAFSAAPPGQGGVGHVNERWPAHWERLFAAHGYRSLDVIRGRLLETDDVAWYYRTNLFIYAREESVKSILAWADSAGVPDPYMTSFQSGVRVGLVQRGWRDLAGALIRKVRRRAGTTRLGGALRRVVPSDGC